MWWGRRCFSKYMFWFCSTVDGDWLSACIAGESPFHILPSMGIDLALQRSILQQDAFIPRSDRVQHCQCCCRRHAYIHWSMTIISNCMNIRGTVEVHCCVVCNKGVVIGADHRSWIIEINKTFRSVDLHQLLWFIQLMKIYRSKHLINFNDSTPVICSSNYPPYKHTWW